MLTDSGKNQLLDAWDITHAGLHSAWPGSTGASNELSGGSPAYARKAVTFGAAASGQRASSTSPVFDVPAAGVVAWITYWTASTAGSCRAIAPNGGSPKEFQVDLTNNRILCEGHGYSNNDTVVFYGGTVPTGLTEGTVYYVISVTAADPDHFQVSATQGGSAIDISGQPAAACVVSKIVTETYGAQGTFTLNSGAVIGLNN